ncbi:MAG: ubiquitin-like small modifier protein 1 [Salinirussus sp.]
MDWRLFATLSEAAGTDTVSVDVRSGATVSDALEALVAEAPPIADHVFDEDGEIYEHVRILKNGRSLDPDELDEPVDADDELAAMPPVSGG